MTSTSMAVTPAINKYSVAFRSLAANVDNSLDYRMGERIAFIDM